MEGVIQAVEAEATAGGISAQQTTRHRCRRKRRPSGEVDSLLKIGVSLDDALTVLLVLSFVDDVQFGVPMGGAHSHGSLQ